MERKMTRWRRGGHLSPPKTTNNNRRCRMTIVPATLKRTTTCSSIGRRVNSSSSSSNHQTIRSDRKWVKGDFLLTNISYWMDLFGRPRGKEETMIKITLKNIISLRHKKCNNFSVNLFEFFIIYMREILIGQSCTTTPALSGSMMAHFNSRNFNYFIYNNQ